LGKGDIPPGQRENMGKPSSKVPWLWDMLVPRRVNPEHPQKASPNKTNCVLFEEKQLSQNHTQRRALVDKT